MRKQQHRKLNKKSQLFMMLLVFITLTTVISIFLVLSEKRANVENYLGEESMNLINGYQEEQKLLHAIELQAKFAYYQSAYDLGLSGGFAITNNCGKYRGFVNYYNDPEFQNCLPLPSAPEKELAILMNKEMKFVEKGINGNEVSVLYNTEVKDNSVIGKANGSIAYTYDAEDKTLNLGSIEIKQLAAEEYGQLNNYENGAVSQTVPYNDLSCKRTTFSRDSESIGTVNCGSLKNGVSFAASHEYYKSDHDPRKRYATVELVNIIEDIGCVLTDDQKYGTQGKIAVGQTSYEYGGKLYLYGDSGNAHASHQSGRDADIGLFYRNEKQELISKQITMVDTNTNIIDPRFNLEANWLFVREFVKHDLAEMIIIHGALEAALLTYAEQQNEDTSLIEKAKQKMKGGYNELGISHRNHFHIRIKCPAGDMLCEDEHKVC